MEQGGCRPQRLDIWERLDIRDDEVRPKENHQQLQALEEQKDSPHKSQSHARLY